MRLHTAGLIILALFCPWVFPIGACSPPVSSGKHGNIQDNDSISSINPYPFIGAIPLPAGYHRLGAAPGSFAGWLRQLPLKGDKTVHLFDGRPKGNQKAQYAVLDVSVGHKDLQQCADAVMRLRAEWLYSRGRTADIDFLDNAHVHYRPGRDTGRAAFDAYLEKVFSYCGSLSLSRQLRDKPLQQVAPGDVFIYGGSPGHAMIVVDVAEDDAGRRLFLLAQSYMPAQEIHVVVNPGHADHSPWYAVEDGPVIETPEWTFSSKQLKTWP